MTALREFIESLEKQKLLLHIKEEIDWRYEIGNLVSKTKAPVLFENIKGYPGHRLFANGLRTSTSLAQALGILHKNIRLPEIVRIMSQAFTNSIRPIFAEAPVHWDHCLTGVPDLTILPVPWWNRKDAGRYLGTWHLNISRDPETGSRNIGVYRMQLLAPNQATVSASPHSHLAQHVAKAERKNQILPMAVAIGVDERLIISAAAAPAYGVDEYALAGGLVGKPIEIVQCLTQPIEVPSDSEIVIEGFIQPGTRRQDGPFIDYAGTPSTNREAFLFEATGLQYRKDAIFRGTAVGSPGAEDHQLYSLLALVGLTDFHGSRTRHLLQTFLLRKRAFSLFQISGRIGTAMRRIC